MEQTSLNEAAPAVDAYPDGTIVEVDAGIGKICAGLLAPNGQRYYDIELSEPVAVAGGHVTRWHDETTPHVEHAVADVSPGPAALAPVAPVDELVHEIATNAIATTVAGLPADPSRILQNTVDAAIAGAREIAPVDMVVMKSGGPRMIVSDLHDGFAKTYWMDGNGELHVATLPLELLALA